jgi:serine/threonine protein kinase
MRRKDRPATAAVLPGYHDATEIGGGAFATVYRAIESDTGRPVALKILKVDRVRDHHVTETFAHEVQALAKVSDHPHIVTLYRPLTTPEGRPALVLELCRESVAEQVRRSGPLDAWQVVGTGIKIGGALETAHRHGFLHRDLKPQNILVTQFGEPALGDFGVAALQASAKATAGVFAFTTLHAAPEILEGGRLSPATDVYGLASSMYQLLTGQAPFAAFDNEAPAAVILRVIRDPVRPLRSDVVPFGLSDLLEAALAKEAAARPATALEFVRALTALQGAAGRPLTPCVVWGEGPPPVPLLTRSPLLEAPSVADQRPAGHTAGPPVVTSPPPPKPPPPQRGPSIAAPAESPRRVISPGPAGPAGPPTPPAAGSPAPPVPGGWVPPPPPPPGRARSAEHPISDRRATNGPPESANEQTVVPGAAVPAGPGARDGQHTPGRHQGLAGSPILLAGLAVAMAVLVAALLLIAGLL